MATNLAIDDNLLQAALQLGGLKTKRATVDQALKEFVQRRRVHELVEQFGTISYDGDYDYKALRIRGQ
jgi:Arc/MetJ family transcription regulator